MILLHQVLETELSQVYEFTVDKRYSIAGFYPYLLMINAPAGTFTFSIQKNSVDVFTKSFSSTDIKTSIPTTNNYAHVFFPIVPVNPVQLEKGTYTFKLTATGYTPNASSYLAWVQQHEDLNNEVEYEPETDLENPLALRIKLYENLH